MSKARNIASISDSALGFRNKIINGSMNVSQRGTSFPAIANGAYSVDRWSHLNTSGAVAAASQQADVPSSNEFQFSLRYAVTSADASIAAGDLMALRQPIEGFNTRDLIGRTFTLSFWVRSSKTGVHCVGFGNDGGDRSFVAEYTVNAANTWEQKSVRVNGGLITAGTWNWTNGRAMVLNFPLAAGTTYQTTAGAWQTGNFFATANQVNCLDTIGNIFAITGVQLETGTSGTLFEHRPYGVELALCQRYFQMIGNTVNNEINVYGYQALASGTMLATYSLPVEMRATPLFTKVGTWSGSNTAGQPIIATSSKQRFTISAIATATGMVQFNNSTAASMYVTADAEL